MANCLDKSKYTYSLQPYILTIVIVVVVDDSANGMWSDDGSPYLPNSWSSSCSGCTCQYKQGLYELGTCTNSTYVSGITIAYVTAETFPVTATSINFFGCSFTSISEDTFTHITGLTTLNLIGNAITVDSKYKGTLPDTIEYLALNSNQIHWLPPGFINGSNLRLVFISQNGFTHLPHQIFMEGNFTELIELYAENNLIRNVAELEERAYGVKRRPIYLQKKQNFSAFTTTPNIVKLYLQNNLIEMINNTDFCGLQGLELLNLQSNVLNETHIQEEGFKCLPVMNDLYLQNNQIIAVENNTFPAQLKILYLDNNRIVAVEDGAFPYQVNTIYMRNNDFRFIHAHPFSYLSQLRSLYLGNNAVDYIPDDAFINATSLAYLQLSSNTITQIKKVHFKNCPLTSGLYLSSNEIGWIEDGSLNHVTSSGTLDFSYNRLYKLPLNGTFHDLSLSSGLYLQNNRLSAILPDTFKTFSCNVLYLQDNRITRIESGAFQDVRANTLNFYNNKLRVIESNAFTTVHADTFSFTGNLVREIQSHAFNGTSCSYFYMQNMNLGVIPSYAFTDFTCGRVNLQSSSITDIKKHAFYNFRVNYNLYLYNNQLNTISSSIFGGTSYVKYLQIYNNGLTSITSDGFRNVDVDYIYLQNNGLTVYPIALNEITPLQIYLNNNEISVIPTGSFDSQTRLQHLYMFNNNVEQISSGLLPPATNLRTIDFHENQIQYIEEGSFTGLTSLQTLDLGQNVIPYFPSVILPAIRTLDLADNRIEALGVLNLGGSVNLDNNFLGCECSTVESLYNVKDGLSANTMCYSPTALQGVLFASSQSNSPDHFTKKDVALFQCSGENIKGTVVSSTNITITWSRPSYLYYLFNTSNDGIFSDMYQ
ncbi:protein artichoke-like [Mytilus trossulus]|uniref:protein artichoke-like n=1 Tax=Mytilus trossulus TaxID=6551 RepID=UPI003004F352